MNLLAQATQWPVCRIDEKTRRLVVMKPRIAAHEKALSDFKADSDRRLADLDQANAAAAERDEHWKRVNATQAGIKRHQRKQAKQEAKAAAARAAVEEDI